MCRRTGSLVLAALLLAAPAAARAALAVQASVDRDELAADETLLLSVQVQADGAPTVALPAGDFPFKVVSTGQQRSTSVDMGGGAGVRIRTTVTFQYALAPLRAGDLTIPALQVTAGQASAETVPLRVTVLPAGSHPQATRPPPRAAPGGPFGGRGLPNGSAGRRAWSGWERDLALVLELDRTEAFLGEEVIASLWLLSPVGVVRADTSQAPMLDGFWAEQLEVAQQLTAERRTVGGVPLQAFLLQRQALFPTRTGELEVGRFVAQAVVRISAEDPFDPFPDMVRVERQSAPARLTVKPLPAGAPAGFDGVNVGTLALEASLSPQTAALGQPVTLRLTARGEGNVKAWALPPAPRVVGVKAFAPSSTDKVGGGKARLSGSRTLEVVLVPEQPGTFTVPAVRWPIFDPRSGVYRVLSTEAMTLEVPAPAPTAAADPGGPAPAPGSHALAEGLRPLRAAGPLSRRGDPPWSGLPFWLLVGAPVALFASLTTWDRLRERHAAGGGARRIRLAGQMARRRLSTAQRLAGGAEAGPFYLELERALQGYCGDKLGRPVTGLTRQELERALAEAGAHPPAVKSLHVALDACDAGRFGGGGTRGQALDLAGRAMAHLEEAHWKHPGSAA